MTEQPTERKDATIYAVVAKSQAVVLDTEVEETADPESEDTE